MLVLLKVGDNNVRTRMVLYIYINSLGHAIENYIPDWLCLATIGRYFKALVDEEMPVEYL